jgi:hypothetical protein
MDVCLQMNLNMNKYIYILLLLLNSKDEIILTTLFVIIIRLGYSFRGAVLYYDIQFRVLRLD